MIGRKLRVGHKPCARKDRVGKAEVVTAIVALEKSAPEIWHPFFKLLKPSKRHDEQAGICRAKLIERLRPVQLHQVLGSEHSG
jgi:hypothetical protein